MSRWKREDASDKSKYMRTWAESEKGQAYRVKHREYAKRWRTNNRAKFLEVQKRANTNIKLETFSHYSNNNVKCACCGEKGIDFLTIDHIYGNGSEHRRKIRPRKKNEWNRDVLLVKKEQLARRLSGSLL